MLFFLDKPADDPEAIGDPYKTLFISRLVSWPVVLVLHFPLTLSIEQKRNRK
jgi:hypothetical protein